MTTDDIDKLIEQVIGNSFDEHHHNARSLRNGRRLASQGRSSGSGHAPGLVEAAARATGVRGNRHPFDIPSRAFAPDAGRSPRAFLLACLTRKALRPIADLWINRPLLLCLDLPPGCAADRVAKAIQTLCAPLDRRVPNSDGVRRTSTVEINPDRSAKSRQLALQRQVALLSSDLGERATLHRRVFLIVEHGAELAPEIAGLCDHRLSLPPPDQRHLAAACRQLLGIEPTAPMLDELAAIPFGEIELILRPGTTARQIDAILRRRAEARAGTAGMGQRHAPHLSLDTLPGMGEAAIWGQELARDLRDWRDGIIPWDDVDRGILLHGKPGTGKTSYARALATTCDVPLIAISVTAWQAAGHLGDLLAAMRASFAEARDKAPCILFLDELDSIGVRAEFTGEHKTYGIQVVNGLLECLDGIEARPGVVVVAACNDPSTVDPAILRAGRLDRMVEIPLPDLDARAAILRYHLGPDARRCDGEDEADGKDDIPFGSAGDDSTLTRIAARLSGATGADIERLVRDARRLARRARHPLYPDDLLSLLPPPTHLSDDERRRFAVHEIGHALAIVIRSPNELQSVWMIGAGKCDLANGIIAAATSRPIPRAVFTLDDLEAELVTLMAGTVAEAVILGSRSTGASGAGNSDLSRATLLAARIELHHGLGVTLASLSSESNRDLGGLLRQDEGLRNRVEMRLRSAYGKAEALIGAHLGIAGQLVAELMQQGELSGDRVREVLAKARTATEPDRLRTT
jgi:ATP-dependent Zn protease